VELDKAEGQRNSILGTSERREYSRSWLFGYPETHQYFSPLSDLGTLSNKA
jgi:hypothetical protein